MHRVKGFYASGADRPFSLQKSMETPSDEIRDWLKDTMRDLGLSGAGWAAKAGVASTTVNRALKPGHKFTLSVTTLRKLAAAVDRPLPLGVGARIVLPSLGMPVRYRVQAGSWEDVETLDQTGLDARYGYSPLTSNPKYPKEAQWAELVVGDSVNKIYPDGSWLHVVDYEVAGIKLRAGMLVVVERRKPHQVQRTVKELHGRPGAWRLVGVSTDKRWNSPLELSCHDPDHEIVEIVGVVIGGYTAREV